MVQSLNIGIVGAGNLAWHLAPALENAGHKVLGIYSRNFTDSKSLCKRLYNGKPLKEPVFDEHYQAVILTVPDDAITNAANALTLEPNIVLAHTSGSKPLDAIPSGKFLQRGVFYPLQTFSKEKRLDISLVPVYIEGETEEAAATLLKLGASISNKVKEINSKERLALHVAAVFASNFSNYMLTISEQILKRAGLPQEALQHLVSEQMQKAFSIGAERAQTGPARRGDLETLDRHLVFLNEDENVTALYKLISQQILNLYHGS